MKKDDTCIGKMTGTFMVPKGLEMDSGVDLKVIGDVVKIAEGSNQDGTSTWTYSIKVREVKDIEKTL